MLTKILETQLFSKSDQVRYTTEVFFSLSAVISGDLTWFLREISRLPPSFNNISMGRNQGNRDLSDLQKGGVLALKTNINLSNRQIAKTQNCNKKSVRNMQRAIL